ncbi:mitochondrial DNA polymerase A [Heterostelium album PN500]|uniref:Mitochondrial DNA polymerase A n=1 Tax=Heterostelium pallidum (strain ATCC 26659 / Pp 5 / PN500) TaxID=670386 RepID=D3BGU4_HETP5|nr:mitochondrial DNA polymerase A [Heterostelium album PN500]EFA79328.1 mitochondrial DNA polymerase A [Heterostelium album PN500]|eukprot:XP_020431449.1 mitochondrial DNA polymerase A [Heterostelium album PN500]
MLNFANRLFKNQTNKNTCTLFQHLQYQQQYINSGIRCTTLNNNTLCSTTQHYSSISNNMSSSSSSSSSNNSNNNNSNTLASNHESNNNNNIKSYKPLIKNNSGKPLFLQNSNNNNSSSNNNNNNNNVNSLNSNGGNGVHLDQTKPPKTIKIKIKSKDPFIELPGGGRIYFDKKPTKKKQSTKDNSESLTTSTSTPTPTSASPIETSSNSITDTTLTTTTTTTTTATNINTPSINTITTAPNISSNVIEEVEEKQKSQYKENVDVVIKVKEEEEEEDDDDDEMVSKKHTLIIDGTPLLYKAFNGSPLLSVDGQPINAIHGYTQSILRFLKDFKPDYVALCFDPRGGSFRRELYPAYKSHRPPMPDDLQSQFALIDHLSDAIGIPVLKIDRYESDDLIATYTRIANEAGHRITIVSDDKDLLQLVTNENISVYRPKSNEIIGESDVSERIGVDSEFVTTFQSLVGDTSDNIPGVPGLGPKTAISIINSFGHLKDILENVENLPTKLQEKIQNLKDQIHLSYQLVTLNKNVNVPPLDSLKFNPINKTKLIEYLDRFKFQRIKDSLYKLDLPFEGEEINAGGVQALKSTKSRAKSKSKVVQSVVNEDQVDGDDIVSAADLVNFNDGDETTTDISVDSESKPKRKKRKSKMEVIDGVEEDAALTEPLDEIYVPVTEEEISRIRMPNVTVVNDVEKAKAIVNQLLSLTYLYHACDTEVVDLDLKKQSPIGHGRIICFSVYCGPDIDFGTGSRLWVDTMGEQGNEILEVFRPYFESESIYKVWHNYGFDRHIFYNHNIDVKGFGGDTLHMARLWDAARNGRGGYSLEGLSKELLDNHKTSIKDLFGKNKIKADGLPGKDIIVPPLEVIQRHPKHLETWIEYSSLDAELTWNLRENLQAKLQNMVWMNDTNMWDFYHNLWRPFGHLLTDMERRGMKVDIEHLKTVEGVATKDIQDNMDAFQQWAVKYCPNAKYMNPSSDAQIQQLLFAPTKNVKTKEEMPLEREFETENTEGFIEEGKKKPKKMRPFLLSGLGLPFGSHTASGWPAVDSASLRDLAGNPSKGKYGKIFNHFKDKSEDKEKGEQEGIEASKAITSLLEIGSVGTLLSSFIIPLQKLCDSNHRVHTSVNVNTETGRLSSKRPNLQNQPALEKDRYKIRKAFTCEPGNTLVVADYGQLELRLLAHITNCRSMINAFKIGGDFHSRTAMGMYPHVKEAVDRGDVLLEWDGDGEPPKPLLKDSFGAERRKAKTLNFSIAYGKTAHGLSKDWGVTLKEAQETLDRWYSDRPEVLLWQRKTIQIANTHKWTRTLMGRYRMLPDIDNPAKGMKGHSERASINTPLQGGAADIVMKAMLMIEEDKRLKELGFQLIMQIHDELILEGPEQHAKEAREIVMRLMSNPLNTPLLVELVVDCRFAKTWYEAK